MSEGKNKQNANRLPPLALDRPSSHVLVSWVLRDAQRRRKRARGLPVYLVRRAGLE
jgi:hypothetical protein